MAQRKFSTPKEEAGRRLVLYSFFGGSYRATPHPYTEKRKMCSAASVSSAEVNSDFKQRLRKGLVR